MNVGDHLLEHAEEGCDRGRVWLDASPATEDALVGGVAGAQTEEPIVVCLEAAVGVPAGFEPVLGTDEGGRVIWGVRERKD